MSEETEILSGSCLCGSVSFEVRSPFLRFAYCHCSRCRKASGTGHSTNLYCAPERSSWLDGKDLIVRQATAVVAVGDGDFFKLSTGSYVTSLEMAGCSVTVNAADAAMLALWDAPVHAPTLRWGC
ncbi:MAG TPA: dihydroxyacetone kinase subunit DhaK [Caldimonas sp.]|jgi:hypothetical protein